MGDIELIVAARDGAIRGDQIRIVSSGEVNDATPSCFGLVSERNGGLLQRKAVGLHVEDSISRSAGKYAGSGELGVGHIEVATHHHRRRCVGIRVSFCPCEPTR